MEIYGFIYGFEVRTGLSYRKARQPGSLDFWDETDAFFDCARLRPDAAGYHEAVFMSRLKSAKS